MRTYLLLAAGLVCGSVAVAAELPGAGEIRRKIETRPAPATAAAVTPGDTAREKIDDLAGKVGSLPPAEAARAWLTLFDEYAARHQVLNNAVAFSELLKALPPPSAWGELRTAINTRPPGDDAKAKIREASLRVFADLLAADAEARTKDTSALAKLLMTTDGNDDQARELITAMTEQIPGDVVKNFESQIDGWTVLQGQATLDIPDLVTLIGEEKATPLIRKAVVLPGAVITANIGAETVKLVQKIMLDEIEKIATPQWHMCSNLHPDSVALFEAMEKKFVKKDPNADPKPEWNLGGVRVRTHDDGAYHTAQAYYLLGLIVAGRTDEAFALTKRMPAQQTYLSYATLDELEKAGHVETVQAFLHKALSENPDLPLWDNYVSLSAKTGKTKEMLELARKSAAREGLDPARQILIRGELTQALLAADEIEEALTVLRARLADPQDKMDEDGMPAAMMMARVGRVLERSTLIDEAMGAARKILSARGQPLQSDHRGQQYVLEVAGMLEEVGRGAEGVDLLADGIARVKQPAGQGEAVGSNAREMAYRLLGIYHRAGRHADVLELLQTLPVWGAEDLAQIYTDQDSHETPVGYMAAAALAEAGRKEEARKVDNAVLDARGGFDPAYELLVKLDGDAAVARLDELFARDQFEERPLIWKGALLLKAGKVDEAEKVIRQAIAIDPSDGEQGKGTRMRVYAVLADILEKKGDAEQAKVFRGAVKAIRTAEDADDWWEAGLLSAAIKRYEQALTFFQDAYCIQSRVALRMAEMGFTEKAEEHYRKAYELMPDSFGRMESHCFGCEGAFKGESARKIAEEVFAKLLKKTPNKPQVHYLLGYLREQQGMTKEALAAMEAAVKLDADYLNAWKHIADLSTRVYTAPEVRDAATLNLLRLDPLRRHVQPDVSGVRDLKKLWEVSSQAAGVRAEPPKELMKLPASKKPKDPHEDAVFMHPPRDDESVAAPPGETIGQTRVVQVVAAVLDSH